MKIFIDSADLDEIRRAQAIGCADGVTTNPTLILKSGVKDLDGRIREIAALVAGPVNAEVTSTTTAAIVEEGKRFAKLGENVHVKIPLNREGLAACRILTQQEIPCTMTLIFSPAQAILAAQAGAGWICPFVGRLDDIGSDGMHLIAQIAEVYRNAADWTTRILTASVRGPLHVVDAALAGADAVTVPYKVLEQMERHPLTEAGIAQFIEDAKKTAR